jgi:hypothetical protein
MHHYTLVPADGHVNKPPTIRSDRLPAKYSDRGPKVVVAGEGDAWIFEGWDGVTNFGFTAAAGLPTQEVSPGVPAPEKELILAGNAVRVYRLDGPTPALRRP